MAEPKGIGKKLLGLFVEDPDAKTEEESPSADPEKSAADLVAELAHATAPEGAGRAPPPPLPNLKLDKLSAPTAGKINFDEIFTQGGLDPAGLERVNKAETLLKGLPEATPHDIKKQIVEASLRAFGIDVVTIIQATTTQLQALDTFVRINSEQTAKGISAAEEQIKQLNEKIAGLRADIDKRTAQLAQTTNAATARKSEVQRVLDFFGAATPPKA
jgi:hypothetical protein